MLERERWPSSRVGKGAGPRAEDTGGGPDLEAIGPANTESGIS